MRLIHLPTWRDAALKQQTYRISAANVEAAVERFKARFPKIEPHTCYEYPVTEAVNMYCFDWRNDENNKMS
jgi:hypothetical protein